ncbi:MAG: FAD-binding oxidoreductase [Rhodobacteraceae bacterium]|nr:FAD-binding oxidoreductase [Paracoccaceae bacterium]
MAKQDADVIVVGAGVWGLCCAFACAKRGLSVRVLEADRIGSGASGGIVGALAPHTPEQWEPKKQFQFEALSEAASFWSGVDALSGQVSGYGRIGRLMPLTSERTRALAEERVDQANQLWQGKYDWTVLSSHPLVAEEIALHGIVFETLSARLFPAHALKSLVAACRALGVQIEEGQRVAEIGAHNVSGPWGKTEAKSVILAAGVSGFSLLEPHVGPMNGQAVKGQAALLDIDLGDAPQIFADGVFVVPHAHGCTAVGSTSEREWQNARLVDEKLDVVLAKAQKICPSLAGAEVIQRFAGLRPRAPRPDPMLGPVPGLEGVYAAMGSFKIGFGIAHKVGEVLADYATGNQVDLPPKFQVGQHLG